MLIKGLLFMLLMGVMSSLPVMNNEVVAQRSATRYVCPMHPDVTSSKPGKCYKCKMALRPVRAKKETPTPPETKPTTDPGAVSSPRLPDVIIQDQHGKSLNFYTDLVKGKVVAINFVFTTLHGHLSFINRDFSQGATAIGRTKGARAVDFDQRRPHHRHSRET